MREAKVQCLVVKNLMNEVVGVIQFLNKAWYQQWIFLYLIMN